MTPLVYITIMLLACMAPASPQILSVDNGGDWGDWAQDYDSCPEGAYATGYRQKIEPAEESRDETGLNGIAILCSDGSHRTSNVGGWGLNDSFADCPEGENLDSFALKVQEHGGDDTAANFIKFRCTDGTEISSNGTWGETWGTWGNWSNSCTGEAGVCGIRTKVEGSQGYFGDDTALNDVRFVCCG